MSMTVESFDKHLSRKLVISEFAGLDRAMMNCKAA